MGSMISFVAVPYQLYQLTHSTVQVGLLAVADLIPLLTLAMVGGTIADAVDRRRLLVLVPRLPGSALAHPTHRPGRADHRSRGAEQRLFESRRGRRAGAGRA